MHATIGVVILANCGLCPFGADGKSSFPRPGCKVRLDALKASLSDFNEIFLTIPDTEDCSLSGFKALISKNSEYSRCKGLSEALKRSGSDWLLSIPCGMLFFTKDLADYLIEYLSSDYDAVIPADRCGKAHPLFGLYSKRAARSLDQLTLSPIDDLHELPGKIKTKYVSLKHSIYPDHLLTVISSSKQYRDLSNEISGPPVVAVSGVKNSGKTTLLKGVIPILVSQGLKVAVVKHDGHDFIPDLPGTDSFILREAGAEVVVVYSSNRYLVNISRSDFSMANIKHLLGKVDVVLYEGGKYSKYPKIEIVRKAISDRPVGDPATMLAICTDADLTFPGVPTIGISDYLSVAKVLNAYLSNNDLSSQVLRKVL